MSILKASEVKRIIKENGKQGSKDFIVAFDDSVRRLLTEKCNNSPNKRLKGVDV